MAVAVHLLDQIDATGPWYFIATDRDIFCGPVSSHNRVFLKAKIKGFGVNEKEIIGGGVFYTNPDAKIVRLTKQISFDYGGAPVWVNIRLQEFFEFFGWTVKIV